MKKDIPMYYYSCPQELGFLEIKLDGFEKVEKAVFVDTKKSTLLLPHTIVKALDDYFQKRKPISTILLSKKVLGTQFQKSIWSVICKTPFGKTITYTDMAEKAGSPAATRAAGTACGKNPVALFVPCHRAVRKTGEDYGYSWGKKRKKWLLDFEANKQK